MVPSAFVMLDKLPLLPSGKVDRQALPAPGGERPQLEHAYVAPRDAVEEQLVAIWTELLGLEQVGIHDDFFDLGGHSLLGTRMLSRILAAFHIHVPLRSLYESPTVAAIAEIISRQQRNQEGLEKMELLREIEQMNEDEVETELGKGEKPAAEVESE